MRATAGARRGVPGKNAHKNTAPLFRKESR